MAVQYVIPVLPAYGWCHIFILWPAVCLNYSTGIAEFNTGAGSGVYDCLVFCCVRLVDLVACNPYRRWLGSRVVSVLNSGAVGPGFKSQPRRCRVTVLSKLFAPIVPLFTEQRNWLQPCRVARVTAESNGSLPPGLWLTSPAGWLPRTGISSGTLRSVIEYGLPLPFTGSWCLEAVIY